MKKLVFMMASLTLALSVQATTIVQITEAAPGAPAISSETMASYDCFIIRGGTLSQAMGKTPETSLAGVNEVVAYLNTDFAANYTALETGSYAMTRDANRKDFRNSSGTGFGERFGVVVYNPVDGRKTEAANIACFRVFNLDNKSTISDSSANAGYWSGWQTAAVPEPTSGLLILVGAAGLALKRKRR